MSHELIQYNVIYLKYRWLWLVQHMLLLLWGDILEGAQSMSRHVSPPDSGNSGKSAQKVVASRGVSDAFGATWLLTATSQPLRNWGLTAIGISSRFTGKTFTSFMSFLVQPVQHFILMFNGVRTWWCAIPFGHCWSTCHWPIWWLPLTFSSWKSGKAMLRRFSQL